MRLHAIAIERLGHAADLPLPAYATPGSVGCDLLAALPGDAPLALAPLARALVPTGIRVALPAGIEGQIRPRSGLALRRGVTVLNAPGTIDQDYRGEVGVILINLSDELHLVHRGEKIAQLVLAPTVRAAWVERALEPGSTSRGERGFGSTG